MKINAVFGLILLTVLFGLSWGTEPILPPYYSYSVSGVLKCDSISDKSNYTILFAGRELKDSAFSVIGGAEGFGNQHSIDVTDRSGAFNLLVNHQFLFDSIRTGYIGSDNTLKFGKAYKVDTDKLIEIMENVPRGNNVGCSSCTTETTEMRIRNYYYKLENADVDICPN